MTSFFDVRDYPEETGESSNNMANRQRQAPEVFNNTGNNRTSQRSQGRQQSQRSQRRSQRTPVNPVIPVINNNGANQQQLLTAISRQPSQRSQSQRPPTAVRQNVGNSSARRRLLNQAISQVIAQSQGPSGVIEISDGTVEENNENNGNNANSMNSQGHHRNNNGYNYNVDDPEVEVLRAQKTSQSQSAASRGYTTPPPRNKTLNLPIVPTFNINMLKAPDANINLNWDYFHLPQDYVTPKFMTELNTQNHQNINRIKTVGINDPKVQESLNRAANEPVKGSPLLHAEQRRVFELAKCINALSTKGGPDRGQIVWANTGSGKTVMALSILLAYWNSDRKLYVVTTLENQEANSPQKYIANLVKFFPRFARKLQEKHGNFFDLQNLFRKHLSKEDMKARVVFLSLKKAANFLGGSTGVYSGTDPVMGHGGSVFVFDEAHRLSLPSNKPLGLPSSKQSAHEQGYLKDIYDKLNKLTPTELAKVHVYGLTATPGNSVESWMNLVSLVRRRGQTPTQFDPRRFSFSEADPQFPKFKETFGGLVTVSDMRGQRNTHACVINKLVHVPMETWYYAAYLSCMEDGSQNKSKNIGLGMALPLNSKNVTSVVPAPILRKMQERNRVVNNCWVSSKFIRLLKELSIKGNGKHFVYSSTHAHLIAKALEMWYGAKDVTLEAASSGATYSVNSMAFIVLDGKTGKKHNILEAFNSPKNGLGARIKIVIATNNEFEGNDFKALQWVHIAEPMSNVLNDRQAVGRGVRYMSHTLLNTSQRKVNVRRWFSVPPLEDRRATLISRLRQHMTTEPRQRKLAVIGKRLALLTDTMKEGLEVDIWKKSLKDPQAVNLYNFEMYLKAAVTSSITNARRAPMWSREFKSVAGRPC